MPRVRVTKNYLSLVMCGAIAVALAACASATDSATQDQPSKKLSDMFATPDWAKAAAARGPAQRAITPEDLISADGRCAGGPEPVAAAGTDGTNPMPATTAEAVAGQGPLPTVSGGIALAMTECQVAQRAGTPERVDIGADGQDRSVTLTYRQGPWPGIYRFRSGRLVSVERVEVPEPVKPKRPAKPAKPKQQMRG